MSSIQEKWAANEEKVAYVKQFPGLFLDWAESVGFKVKKVIPLSDRTGAVLSMSDGSFTVVQAIDPTVHQILEAIQALRPELETRYSEAYRTLDQKVARDRELARKARMEKILGAIRNNVSEIPELKGEIKELLEHLPG